MESEINKSSNHATEALILTFLGALDNMTLKYNNKFLENRMLYGVYCDKYADTGDVLLFQTSGYLAKSMRTMTKKVNMIISPLY